MKNIKIIVATHKAFDMPHDAMYMPIHVGKKGKHDIGYVGDDSGDNISHLNPYYSELTGLYWAWKNLECDYLGLVHYRRYLTPRKVSYTENMNMNEVILSHQDVDTLLDTCDVIVPQKRRYYIETLYSHYAHTHDANHLDQTRRIIEKQAPEYLESYDTVMKQRSGYMFNMFVMKKELVDDYLSWLFPILETLQQRLDITDYSAFDARLFGRVSERLFNVWLHQKGLSVKEIPFVYMEKINKWQKVTAFLKAKFFGQKYGKSF